MRQAAALLLVLMSCASGGEPPPAGSPSDSYEGEICGGLRHGRGVLTLPSGTIVSGVFCRGVAHGPGEILYANGGRFAGNLVGFHPTGAGDVYGQGEITYPDGAVYAGELSELGADGCGTMRDLSGIRTTGFWRAGRLVSADPPIDLIMRLYHADAPEPEACTCADVHVERRLLGPCEPPPADSQ